MFWRLLVASLVMLVFGYLGEAGYISALFGWIIGTAAWVYIIFELFSGEAGKAMKKSGNKALENCIYCNENDCNSWLGYLSFRIPIWLSFRWSRH